MKELNSIKAEIQQQAHAAWLAAGRIGTIAAGTGFGKSRVAIMEIARVLEEEVSDSFNSILLVTPTEKLRDVNWPQEFDDWGYSNFACQVKCICFASLKKEIGNKYKLVIIDEIHHVTSLSAAAFLETGVNPLTEFCAANLGSTVMGLTATVPDAKRDPEKAKIIAQIAPVVFTYSLDQGVEDGMIRDYEIRIIQSSLDNVHKCIDAGTKLKPFKTTEEAQYQYLEKNIRRFRALEASALPAKKAGFAKLSMFATMSRNRFLYNLPSKTELARRCIKHIATGKRTLVFCGSIEQCNLLLGDNVYHSKSGSDAFRKFNAEEIDILGVVNAANEGLNFVNLDQGLVIQVDSNERSITQRIGRFLRLGLDGPAIIYILCIQNTADERWLDKSLKGFDQSKITYYSSKNVPA